MCVRVFCSRIESAASSILDVCVDVYVCVWQRERKREDNKRV